MNVAQLIAQLTAENPDSNVVVVVNGAPCEVTGCDPGSDAQTTLLTVKEAE